jgi:outer membrane protein assembly factor BamB
VIRRPRLRFLVLVSSVVLLISVAVVVFRPSGTRGVLVAIDARTGRTIFDVATGGRAGASLTGIGATQSVVVALRQRCLSEDRRYRSGDMVLMGFDARSGTVRWSLDDRFLATRGEAQIPGHGPLPVGTVETESNSGAAATSLEGVDPSTGAIRWRRDDVAYQRAVGITDGVVVLEYEATSSDGPSAGRGSTLITALTRSTGETLWTREYDPATRVEAVASDLDLIAIATTAEALSSEASPQLTVNTLSVLSGDPVSTISYASGTSEAQVFAMELRGSNLIVLDGALTLRSFDAHTGEAKWVRQLELGPATQFVTSAQREILTYVSGPSRALTLSAVRADSGEFLWSRAMPEGFAGDAASDTSTVALNNRRKVVAHDLLSGERLWQMPRPGHTEVLINGSRNYFVAGGCATAS